jgi:2-alkenal reductase
MTVSLTLAARPSSKSQSASENAPQTTPRTVRGGAWLGISGMTLTPEIADEMGLDSDQTGALVGEVVTGSPAEKAGLQGSDETFELNGQQIMVGGDVITAVDGKAVETMQELSAAIKAQKPGDKVELTVLRDGEEITVAVALGQQSGGQNAPSQRNEQQPSQPQQPQQSKPTTSGAWLGISGMTLTPEIAQAMDLNSDQTGALVGEVVTGSPAEKYGLQGSDKDFNANGEQIKIGGDVITAVDGKAVETMEDLSSAVKAQKPGDKVELNVLRDGKAITVIVTLGERPAQSN